MNLQAPRKVLITGGVAGLQSYAEGLAEGFLELGIECQVISPTEVWSHWRELRDDKILKILSTTAAFAVPFARRAMCIAHGIGSARYQGWHRSLPILLTFKMANIFNGCQLISISDYVTTHLSYLYDLRIDGTVRNPVKSLFLEKLPYQEGERNYITYVGRLIPVKNAVKLLPPVCDILKENPDLRACIIGDGPERKALEIIADGNERIEFLGDRDHIFIRERLRRSVLFLSGKIQEGFGIVYLEALSQGCVVAMPASGGGMEIALQQVGTGVHLLPINFNHAEVLAVLRQALHSHPAPVDLTPYSAKEVAAAYLNVDRQRSFDARTQGDLVQVS